MPILLRARRWTLVVVLSMVAVTALRAEDGSGDNGVKKESKWGKFGLDLRYRLELVEDDAFTDDAYASTLRTILHYTTPAWKGLSGFVLFRDVSNLGAADAHNDSRNGVSGRPLIPDPPDTAVAQVLARYDGLVDTEFILGRQEISLDEERFVGPVGWRQNYQTYNAFRVIQKSIPNTTWTYAYVGKAHTVVATTADMDTHLLNAAVDILEAGTLTPYVYRIDYDSDPLTLFSTVSYGLRWQGTARIGKRWSLPYHAELAQQDDVGNNPRTVDARYYRLEGRGKRDSLWVALGVEVLGGSVADGQFSTPLATLHRWNGLADKFVITPPDGLRDFYAAAGDKVGPVTLTGFYHQFSADSTSATYGRELDAIASYTAPWKQVLAFGLAYYDADELFEDTLKVWLWSTYRF